MWTRLKNYRLVSLLVSTCFFLNNFLYLLFSYRLHVTHTEDNIGEQNIYNMVEPTLPVEIIFYDLYYCVKILDLVNLCQNQFVLFYFV